MPGFELIDKKEKDAVNKVFKEGGILFAHGFDKVRKKFHVREFETKCAKYFSAKYCLAVTSGTAAIKIGLKALGVKPGDEVITQAHNFIATVEAILDLNAVPKIVNIDKSLNMDPNELKKIITKKTKAVIPVHMLGVACEMTKIKNICRMKNVKILEDNCEAIGGKFKKQHLGTIGEIGAFSLDFGKMITTGEGGLILTNNKKYFKFCKEYHDHGHENNKKFPRGRDTKKIYGFNYRMTELQGAIGKVQLSKLNFILKQNKIRYKILEKMISKEFKLREIPKKSSPSYDTFIFFVESNTEKYKALKAIKKCGFGTKNIPDAIQWHCSSFWNHALNKKEIKNSLKTKKILNASIAIPINLKVSPKKYELLAKTILKSK